MYLILILNNNTQPISKIYEEKLFREDNIE